MTSGRHDPLILTTHHSPLTTGHSLDLDDEICLCFHVSKRKVVNFLRVEKPRRVSQISECFGAGTGCGWCRPFLLRYFEQMAAADEIGPDEVTKDQYARGRTRYVRQGHGTPPAGATPIDDEP